MRLLTVIKNTIDRLLQVACVALFATLVVVVTWQVFTRQVLSSSSEWTTVLSQYLFIWLALLGSALVFGERGHIAIDVVVRRLPLAVQRIVAILIQLLVIAFTAAILVWGGWRVSMLAWDQNLSGLNTAIGPWYLVMPISGVLIIFYSVYHALDVGKDAEEPFTPEEDVPDAV